MFRTVGNRCVSDIDQHNRMMLAFVVPIVCMVQLGLIYILHGFLYKTGHPDYQRAQTPEGALPSSSTSRLDASGGGSSSQTFDRTSTRNVFQVGFGEHITRTDEDGKYAFYPAKYVRALLCLYFLTLTGMVRALFEYFDCVEIGDGIRVVRQFPAVDCSSSDYKDLMIPAVSMLTILLVLIPGLLLHRLIKASKNRTINEFSFRSLFGYMNESYVNRFYFWELIVVYRRVVLVALSVFLFGDRISKFAAMTMANAMILVFHVRFAPFYSVSDNLWEFFSLSIITLLSLVLPMLSEPYSDGSQAVIGCFVFFPLAILVGQRALKRARAQKLEKKRIEEEEAERNAFSKRGFTPKSRGRRGRGRYSHNAGEVELTSRLGSVSHRGGEEGGGLESVRERGTSHVSDHAEAVFPDDEDRYDDEEWSDSPDEAEVVIPEKNLTHNKVRALVMSKVQKRKHDPSYMTTSRSGHLNASKGTTIKSSQSSRAHKTGSTATLHEPSRPHLPHHGRFSKPALLNPDEVDMSMTSSDKPTPAVSRTHDSTDPGTVRQQKRQAHKDRRNKVIGRP